MKRFEKCRNDALLVLVMPAAVSNLTSAALSPKRTRGLLPVARPSAYTSLLQPTTPPSTQTRPQQLLKQSEYQMCLYLHS